MGLDFGSAWRVDEYEWSPQKTVMRDGQMSAIGLSGGRLLSPGGCLTVWNAPAKGLRAGAPKTTHPRETINRARIWVTTIALRDGSSCLIHSVGVALVNPALRRIKT